MSEELYRFVSLKVIIDRLMRDPIMQDLNIDNAITDAVDCIQLIANPSFMDRQDVVLHVEDYRAELPYNIVNIVTTKYIDSADNKISMNVIGSPSYKTPPESYNSGHINYEEYKVNGDYLYTNFKEGKLLMSYEAIPLDTDGFIMIPDDIAVIKCVESHIKFEHYLLKFNMGKLPQYSLVKVEEDKRHYMGKAQSSKLMEGLDTAKSMSNILNKLLTKEDHHLTNYSYLTNKENLRLYK